MMNSNSFPSAYDQAKSVRRQARKASIFEKKLVQNALSRSIMMLDPRAMVKNPVMFVTEAGAFLTTLIAVSNALTGAGHQLYTVAVMLILWLTVMFSNFAEALAEARGKAQTDTLKRTRQSTVARRVINGKEESVSSDNLQEGDRVIVLTGEIIPGDGEVVEGAAMVDESAITGESAPVVREAGGDRSGVVGGTRVISDHIVVRISVSAGHSFLDKMIALVEGAVRQKTPNELALTVTLAGLTLAFLMVTGTLWPIGRYFGIMLPVPTLVALLVCLIPTTIGALLSAIGLAGMDRALSANVLAKSGKAVELAGDIDTLLLDKTGTITIGNRQATDYFPLPGIQRERLALVAMKASFGDQTPEGKSIITLAEEMLGIKAPAEVDGNVVPFSAQSRMSGIDLPDGQSLRKGALDTLISFCEKQGGSVSEKLQGLVDDVARKGMTPIVVAEGGELLGSELIAQQFTRPEYFWSRPSAVSWNAAGAGGSNLSPASMAARQRTEKLLAELALKKGEKVPADLVTASGSGLDPHISLAAAKFQVPRVAFARGLSIDQVLRVLDKPANGKSILPFTSEFLVNVLQLNRSLDRLKK